MSEKLDDTFRPPVELRVKVKEISEELLTFVKIKARQIGWCVTGHGSMVRDLDLLAAPWQDDAVSSVELVECVRLAFAEFVNGKAYKSCEFTKKPFGRRAYTIYAVTDDEAKIVSCKNGSFPFIDLSIMDPRNFDKDRSDL